MMFSLSELIAFSVILVIIALLIVGNIRMYYMNKKTMASLIQTTLDSLELREALDKLANEYELLSLQETDGFVKFLSESRESAFLYIEEVQQSIKELATAMDSASENNIEMAYKSLLKHLPKEENND
jgi:biopolymer transport protein ExbB/TolQ